MKRRIFLTGIAAASVLAVSCSQKEKPRYNPKECPFCTESLGKCLHCRGSGKCSYCKGTGKRMSQTMEDPTANMKKIVVPETCPFCKGTGKCSYCNGSGNCPVCKGTKKLEKWEW